MTNQETLKLALEALEMYCEHGAILRPLETRDAIKEALAKQDFIEPVFGQGISHNPYCNDADSNEPNSRAMMWHNKLLSLDNQLAKQEQGDPTCKTHPDAPHGFVRNASHTADRYVCECEFWEPSKQEHGEPDYWLGYGLQAHTEKPFEDATPLYTTPQQRTWVGLNDEDRRLIRKWTTYNQFMTAGEYAEAVQIATEEKLKELNT